MHERRAIWPVGLDWACAREKRDNRREKRKRRVAVSLFIVFSRCDHFLLVASVLPDGPWYASALLGQILHASVHWHGPIYGRAFCSATCNELLRCSLGWAWVLLIFYQDPTWWKIEFGSSEVAKATSEGRKLLLAIRLASNGPIGDLLHIFSACWWVGHIASKQIAQTTMREGYICLLTHKRKEKQRERWKSVWRAISETDYRLAGRDKLLCMAIFGKI